MIRRQSLEEWFLCHQLRHIQRNHFHLPMSLEADVTAIAQEFEAKDAKVPYTAILIKALALTARTQPQINRMVFSTLFGKRVVEFERVRINVPVLVEDGGRQVLAVTTIDDADKLSLVEIQDRLRRAKSIPLETLLVGKYVVGRRNHIFNRLRLRLVHGLVFKFPSLYAKRGGGLTVSSLLQHREPGFDVLLHAYGPTAITLCSAAVNRDDAGRWKLHVGIGMDHYALSGDQGTRALRDLNRNLTTLTDHA